MNKEKTKDDGKMSAAIRESKMAWDEFFKNKPKPKNKLDEKKQFEDYINWYNNERKQSDTGKTPAEMYNEVYGEEPPSPVNLSEKPSRVMSFEWDENYKEPDEILDEAKDLIMNGKYEVALKLINNVLEIVYDDPEVLYLKIGALTPLGKIDEAENILKEIDKKYGKSSDWYLSKAAVSFFTGNIARAL